METPESLGRPIRCEIAINGKMVPAAVLETGGHIVVVTGRLLRVAHIKDEAHQIELAEPESLLARIRQSGLKADLFTFDQKIPNYEPRHPYYHEMSNLAVINIASYEDWWNNKIQNDARRMVRKAAKNGVETRAVPYSDELIQGIKEIWDESPFRQGRPFYHYQKDFATVKALNTTYLDRAGFIGSYLNGELIGFAKLFYTGERADLIQIISKVKHRDKAPTNALLAKAVEVCAQKGIKHLGYARFVYGKKGPDTLTEWKIRNGCEQVFVPRYYVPLTFRGRLALSLKLHQGLKQLMPSAAVKTFLHWRDRYYSYRYREQPAR